MGLPLLYQTFDIGILQPSEGVKCVTQHLGLDKMSVCDKDDRLLAKGHTRRCNGGLREEDTTPLSALAELH